MFPGSAHDIQRLNLIAEGAAAWPQQDSATSAAMPDLPHGRFVQCCSPWMGAARRPALSIVLAATVDKVSFAHDKKNPGDLRHRGKFFNSNLESILAYSAQRTCQMCQSPPAE